MTAAEIGTFKIELLDDSHDPARDAIADPDSIRRKVEAFLGSLEAHIGEES